MDLPTLVCVCVCGHHVQQTGHQPGVIANNPPRGQLNNENRFFPASVRA